MNELYYDAEIAQKYTMLEVLGQGGFGTVFKAKQLDLKRTVAIKYLSIERSMNERERTHFQNEARILSSLKHPNVVEVYAFGITTAGIPFIVMEYVEGNLLSSEINQSPMLEVRAQKIALQLCKAIRAVHEAGIVHRDLKPQNIILTGMESGEKIKLLDFGLSKLLTTDASAQTATSTKTGTLIGSPLYMSPEACRGEKGDARSDIYSWGCIIYECLTGQAPFSAESTMGLLYKHCNEIPKSLAEYSLNPPVSLEFEGIIQKCLSKDPNMRYTNACNLEEDLMNLQLGKTISIERQRKTSSTRSARLASILFVSALIVITFVLFSYAAMQKKQIADKQIHVQAPKNQQKLRNLKGSPEARLRQVAEIFARNTKLVEKDSAHKQMLLTELNTLLTLADKTHSKKLRYMTYIVLGRVHQAADEKNEALICLDKALKASLLESGAPTGNCAIPKLYIAQLELAMGNYQDARQSAKTALELDSKDPIYSIPANLPFANYGNMSFVYDAYNTEALAAYYLKDHLESLPLLERAHQYAKEIHKLDMNVEIGRLDELKRAEGAKSAVDAATELFEDIKVYRDDIGYIIKQSREGEYYMTKAGHVDSLARLAQWFEINQKDSMAKSCYEIILEQALQHQLQLDAVTKNKIAIFFPDRIKELRANR